jgi:hypothetical protein
MTTDRLARAAADLERATAARRAAADAWERSRDYLDMGPLLAAIRAEAAATDNYHFCRDLESCQSFCMTYRFPITSPLSAYRRAA